MCLGDLILVMLCLRSGLTPLALPCSLPLRLGAGLSSERDPAGGICLPVVASALGQDAHFPEAVGFLL